jgi:hypothetical protein
LDDVVDKFATKINNEAKQEVKQIGDPKQVIDLSTPPYSGLPQIKPSVV